MKSRSRSHLLFSPIIAMGALTGGVNGAVLVFDLVGVGNGAILDESYGDRITATTIGDFTYGADGGFTPNLEVAYNGAGDLSFWASGYSDLTNVVYYEPESAAGYSITISADPGFQAQLTAFDLGNFGSGVTLPSVQVIGSANNVLFAQSDVILGSNATPRLEFNFPSGLADTEVTIQIDTTGLGGNSDNVGIDNITFSQAVQVPEPSSIWLLGLSAAGVAFRRSRTQRA